MQKIIADNTIRSLDLFSEESKQMCIFHIPHASTYIPYQDYYLNEEYKKDVIYLTDWLVDRIFLVDNVNQIRTPFSRVWCDVERLDDEVEPMFKKGQGFYYTDNIFGKKYRYDNKKQKSTIYNNFYLKHQENVVSIVQDKINKFGGCIIIDSHTFLDSIVTDKPDICIGTDEYHTPERLINRFKLLFESFNYKVKINKPFSGTFVPKKLYKKDKKLESIMIDINKKLYMDIEYDNNNMIKKQTINNNKINILKNQISEFFE